MATQPSHIRFAQFGGEMAESIGFNKSIGQIYCYLYLSPTSLSLEEIAKALGMSKGNASINLRTLESWGAVRPVMVSGSRRDHYEANTNLTEVALRRVQEGMTKRLEVAESRLQSLDGINPEMKGKVEDLLKLIGKARKGLGVLPKVLNFFG